MHQIILGHVEDIAIPALGVDHVLAKVDTGAFSGALHCTDIQLSSDKKVLSFNPIGREDLRAYLHDFEIRKVKSASGHTEERFLVPISIQLHGNLFTTTIGLTDRSDMVREMLLGRRFLREHNMVVDVTMSEEYDDEWKRVNL
jgi:hypothetical protein